MSLPWMVDAVDGDDVDVAAVDGDAVEVDAVEVDAPADEPEVGSVDEPDAGPDA